MSHLYSNGERGLGCPGPFQDCHRYVGRALLDKPDQGGCHSGGQIAQNLPGLLTGDHHERVRVLGVAWLVLQARHLAGFHLSSRMEPPAHCKALEAAACARLSAVAAAAVVHRVWTGHWRCAGTWLPEGLLASGVIAMLTTRSDTMLSRYLLWASLTPCCGTAAALPLRLLAPGTPAGLLRLQRSGQSFWMWRSCSPAALCIAVAVVRAPA